MISKRVDDRQLYVGRGAVGERDLLVDHPFGEFGIFEQASSMVDAVDPGFDHVADVVGGAIFAAVETGLEADVLGLGHKWRKHAVVETSLG